MGLGLGNVLGQHFLSDISNPGSVSFSGASSLNENVASFSTASYVFTINSLSVGPIAAVPEPETVVMFLGGLLFFGIMTRRKNLQFS
jgi:hypothetical protein